jgi:hypothetical protein
MRNEHSVLQLYVARMETNYFILLYFTTNYFTYCNAINSRRHSFMWHA